MKIMIVLGAVAASCVPGFAAVSTATGSTVDFSPILNPLIQGVGGVLAVLAVPAMLGGVNWILQKLKLKKIEVSAALQAKMDSEAQKAIGGAFSRIVIPPGQTVLDVKNLVVADAVQNLVTNSADALKAVTTGPAEAAAARIVENRIGLMVASAAGTPVPNPSQPVAAAAPIVAAAPGAAI